MGGELVFAQEHLLTTSTRVAGGAVWDVPFEPRDDGTIRLSLTEPREDDCSDGEGAGVPGLVR